MLKYSDIAVLSMLPLLLSGSRGDMFLLDDMSPFTPLRAGDELAGIDLNYEYELIQQKKSGLSARLRGRVIYIIESRRQNETANR